MLHEGAGEMICCARPMSLMSENMVDAAREKHVPVVESTGVAVRVQVGSVAHPMEERHYIEWIEAIADGRICRRELKPGDAPEAEFNLDAGNAYARAYCNLHGLWKGGR